MDSSKDAGPLKTKQLLMWAQRVQAIAQTGLAYTRDPYDKERYEQLREVAAEILAASAQHVPAELIEGFTAERGYATPKIDVRAAVFSRHRLLLVKERSDGKWTLPGGWADIGESPSVSMVREVQEEAGYAVIARKLAAVQDRNLHGHPPMVFHVYKMFFICELAEAERVADGGAGSETNIEIAEVGFFAEDQLPPLSLARVVPAQIELLFGHYRHPEWATSFD